MTSHHSVWVFTVYITHIFMFTLSEPAHWTEIHSSVTLLKIFNILLLLLDQDYWILGMIILSRWICMLSEHWKVKVMMKLQLKQSFTFLKMIWKSLGKFYTSLFWSMNIFKFEQGHNNGYQIILAVCLLYVIVIDKTDVAAVFWVMPEWQLLLSASWWGLDLLCQL